MPQRSSSPTGTPFLLRKGYAGRRSQGQSMTGRQLGAAAQHGRTRVAPSGGAGGPWPARIGRHAQPGAVRPAAIGVDSAESEIQGRGERGERGPTRSSVALWFPVNWGALRSRRTCCSASHSLPPAPRPCRIPPRRARALRSPAGSPPPTTSALRPTPSCWQSTACSLPPSMGGSTTAPLRGPLAGAAPPARAEGSPWRFPCQCQCRGGIGRCRAAKRRSRAAMTCPAASCLA